MEGPGHAGGPPRRLRLDGPGVRARLQDDAGAAREILGRHDPGRAARALEIGDAIYLEYADPYAKPRLAQKLRQARLKVTGSRTGFAGSLKIEIPGPNGSTIIDGSDYYDEKFWNPNLYFRMQDSDWKEFGEGRVDIGELQSVGEFTVPADATAEDEGEGEGEDDSPR